MQAHCRDCVKVRVYGHVSVLESYESVARSPVTYNCWILNGFTCFRRVIKDSRWHKGVLLLLAQTALGGWPRAPNANHIEHAEEDAVETRQGCRVLDDVVHRGEPFDESVLGAWRRLPLPLAKSPDDGNDDVGWDTLGRIEVLDQGSHTGLIQLCLP